MKRILAIMLALYLMLPGLALAQSADEMLSKGQDYLARGDYASAAISFDIARKLAPEDVRVLVALCRLNSLKGDHAGALEAIEAAIGLEPANGELYLAKAEALREAGNEAEAEIALQYAAVCGAEIPPSNPLADAVKTGSINAVIHIPDFTGFYYSCSKAYFDANADSLDEEIAAVATEDGLRMLMAPVAPEEGEDFSIVSLSPSGKIGLWADDGAVYAAVDGELRRFTPNYDRGARCDGYEEDNFKKFDRLGNGLISDSIVWSADEQYFAVTAGNTLDIRDLIIGDVRTGDLFLAEATPTFPAVRGPQAQRALDAAFDPNGKYVYYTVSALPGGMGLKRYDLAGGQAETLVSFDSGCTALRNLFVNADGTVCTAANFKDMDAQLLTCREENGVWTSEAAPIAKAGHMQMVQKYLGKTLTLGCFRDKAYEAYLVYNGAALPVQENAGPLFAAAEDAAVHEGNIGLQVINLALSPDGRFALAAVNVNRETKLRLIDLETLTSAEVATPEDMRLMVAMPYSNMSAAFAWVGDGIFILQLDGQNRLCSFQFP